MEILTPFRRRNRNADARAFAALMKHLQSTDAMEQTVVMIQVENEIGMIPDPGITVRRRMRPMLGRSPRGS